MAAIVNKNTGKCAASVGKYMCRSNVHPSTRVTWWYAQADLYNMYDCGAIIIIIIIIIIMIIIIYIIVMHVRTIM